MPSYVIEFDSNHGPERRLFTLDDDRTLDVQLFQVLEELRQNDRVLRGAPGDELAVSWNGVELNQRAPLHTLGVNATRPLVLYMRPRVVVAPPPPPPPVRSKYTLRHMILPPVEGAIGALAAWALGGMLTDLRAPIGAIDSVARTDITVAVLLAGAVGLALCIGSTVRGLFRAPAAVLSTIGSAVAGLLVFAALSMIGETPTVREFLIARVVAWLLIAIAVALVVTAPLRELGGQRFVEAVVIAACAGLLAALTASLPGVSDLWQAMAFITCGALVGAAAVSIPVWRTAASISSPAARARTA